MKNYNIKKTSKELYVIKTDSENFTPEYFDTKEEREKELKEFEKEIKKYPYEIKIKDIEKVEIYEIEGKRIYIFLDFLNDFYIAIIGNEEPKYFRDLGYLFSYLKNYEIFFNKEVIEEIKKIINNLAKNKGLK